jgi:diguanylate cyclase (GGDEF)-like protein
VFRIGGDEFSVILQNDDLENREALAEEFTHAMAEISDHASNAWDEVHIAMGIAVYDSQCDRSVSDVQRRADELMYDNKRMRKRSRRG